MNLQPSTSAQHCTNEKKEDIILDALTHRVDRYGGIIVDETLFHLHVKPQLTAERFDALLAKSIDTWLKESRRGNSAASPDYLSSTYRFVGKNSEGAR